MKKLDDLKRHTVLRTKMVVIDTTNSDQERLDILNQKISNLLHEKLILDLEKTRMDLVIHVTEANNRRCEFWKEALEQTNSNYKQAIDLHTSMLDSLEKEIKELEKLKENYKSVTNQSRIEHQSYIDGIKQLEEDQQNASDHIHQLGSEIEETSHRAQQELKEIDKESLETSIYKIALQKKMEEENKLEMIKLGVLRSKAQYFESKTGISAFNSDSKKGVAEVGDKLRVFKDSKEKLEALKIYKESLELTMNAMMRKKMLDPDGGVGQNGHQVTQSALEDLKTKAESVQNLAEQRGKVRLKSREIFENSIILCYSH